MKLQMKEDVMELDDFVVVEVDFVEQWWLEFE